METDMDLDVAAAKGGVKRPAVAVEDLEDDDGEQRFEEKLRTKVHKGRSWVYPLEISEILHRVRIHSIRMADSIARSAKLREDLARQYYQTPAASAVTSG